MQPTKSKGKCAVSFHMNETKILSQIEEVLKSTSIPIHILIDIQDELKNCSDKEHKHLVSERSQLQNKMRSAEEKLKRARDLLLDLSVT